MTSTARVRDRGLQVVFALALAWALLSFGLMFFGEHVGRLNPFPEGHALHRVAEDSVPPLAVIALAGILTALLVRFVPRFLSFPRSVTSTRMAITFLVATVIVGIVLLVGLVGTSFVIDPPGPHPENPQHIPLLFWIAPWATAALTPIGGILVAWWWILWRSSR